MVNTALGLCHTVLTRSTLHSTCRRGRTRLTLSPGTAAGTRPAVLRTGALRLVSIAEAIGASSRLARPIRADMLPTVPVLLFLDPARIEPVDVAIGALLVVLHRASALPGLAHFPARTFVAYHTIAAAVDQCIPAQAIHPGTAAGTAAGTVPGAIALVLSETTLVVTADDLALPRLTTLSVSTGAATPGTAIVPAFLACARGYRLVLRLAVDVVEEAVVVIIGVNAVGLIVAVVVWEALVHLVVAVVVQSVAVFNGRLAARSILAFAHADADNFAFGSILL